MAPPLEDDLESLLAPLPGDNPAGEPAPYGVREELDEARRRSTRATSRPTTPAGRS